MLLTTIELENMEFYAFHGHYTEEQVVGNRFRVDFSFEVDSQSSAATDSLDTTVSYLDVYECIKEQMAIPSHLLEHVASRIIAAIKERFPTIITMSLKIAKLAPPLGGQVKRVSVTIKG